MPDFIQTIANAGFNPPDHIAPGKFYRFSGLDKKPSNRAGYCILFDDGIAGVFGDFSTGFKQTWFDGSSRDLTLHEQLKLREKLRVAEGHRRADLEIIRNDAAAEAQRLWSSASTEVTHRYPEAKQITPYSARQSGNALLVPMYFKGKLTNLQRIYPDGTKRFLKGGRVTGCYIPMGDLSDHIHICEGYATGCSLLDHLPAVCVAFNAGNLKPVALAIREKYPRIKITVACDNDHETEKRTGTNPGLEKGRAAASAVGGDVIWPDFSDEDFDGSDWNDYLSQGGEL